MTKKEVNELKLATKIKLIIIDPLIVVLLIVIVDMDLQTFIYFVTQMPFFYFFVAIILLA